MQRSLGHARSHASSEFLYLLLGLRSAEEPHDGGVGVCLFSSVIVFVVLGNLKPLEQFFYVLFGPYGVALRGHRCSWQSAEKPD